MTAIASATDLADAGRFRVRRWQGSAAELHGLDWPEPLVPTVWRMEVDRPTLVLGSTQRVADVDRPLLERLGVALATRRSGGGAVLVEPGNGVWIDVLVPRHDPVWVDDVGRSFDWLGRAWVDALATLGLVAQVHDGPPDRGSSAAAVCFAGLGSGEVTVGGAKAVGLSQRRTRAGRAPPVHLLPALASRAPPGAGGGAGRAACGGGGRPRSRSGGRRPGGGVGPAAQPLRLTPQSLRAFDTAVCTVLVLLPLSLESSRAARPEMILPVAQVF